MKNKLMEGKAKKWIKRIAVILIVVGLLAFGAYKLFLNKTYNVEKTAKETLENLTSYYMEANMEFFKGEDNRKYDVKVSYQKGNENDNFKVSMYDKTSLQEQMIIKNDEGVFVLTPALNQVYKFKGDWPLNGHKPYLYHSMIETMQSNCDISKIDEGYLIVSTPEFKNMPSWSRQEMKLTKEYKPEWVHIYDTNNDPVVKINFTKVEFNPSFSANYFNVENNMEEARKNLTAQSSSTEYELPYYPVNADVDATIKEISNIVVDNVSQTMLTYSGKNNFTILESLSKANKELVITEVSGELVDIYGICGYVETNSNINKLHFSANGINYEIWSNTENVATLIEVASGMESGTDLK